MQFVIISISKVVKYLRDQLPIGNMKISSFTKALETSLLTSSANLLLLNDSNKLSTESFWIALFELRAIESLAKSGYN